MPYPEEIETMLQSLQDSATGLHRWCKDNHRVLKKLLTDAERERFTLLIGLASEMLTDSSLFMALGTKWTGLPHAGSGYELVQPETHDRQS